MSADIDPRAARRLAAIATDLVIGEPPAPVHPTIWMGRVLGRARSVNAERRWMPAAALIRGALVVGGGALAAALAGRGAERLLAGVPSHLGAVLSGLALKPAVSLRALVAAGAEVERALEAGHLAEARRLLAWNLVSRDTSRLSKSEVAGAAIESLAENLSDAVVAPLLYDALGGLGAAYAYRFVNTADAMLGYRTPRLEWFGKSAARLDDALNFVPARLSALLIAVAAPAVGGSTARAFVAALADAGATPSPNAGWPMAAMAGALGVRLDKRQPALAARGPRIAPRLYVLNPRGRSATSADLRRARRLIVVAAGFGLAASHRWDRTHRIVR